MQPSAASTSDLLQGESTAEMAQVRELSGGTPARAAANPPYLAPPQVWKLSAGRRETSSSRGFSAFDKMGYGAHLLVGDQMMARDAKGDWGTAEIRLVDTQTSGGQCRFRVHFVGWPGCDEWIRVGVGRLKPSRKSRSQYGHGARGTRLRVQWDDGGTWYPGKVKEFNDLTQKHLVVFDDGDEDWYHLDVEEDAGLLEWKGSAPRVVATLLAASTMTTVGLAAGASPRTSAAAAAPAPAMNSVKMTRGHVPQVVIGKHGRNDASSGAARNKRRIGADDDEEEEEGPGFATADDAMEDAIWELPLAQMAKVATTDRSADRAAAGSKPSHPSPSASGKMLTAADVGASSSKEPKSQSLSRVASCTTTEQSLPASRNTGSSTIGNASPKRPKVPAGMLSRASYAESLGTTLSDGGWAFTHLDGASRITSPTKPSLKPLPKPPTPVSAPTPAPGPDPVPTPAPAPAPPAPPADDQPVESEDEDEIPLIERKRRRTAEPAAVIRPAGVTAEEAVRQVEAEGLMLQASDNATGFKGVSFSTSGRCKPYQAQVWRHGKPVNLGNFATAEEAALNYARDIAANVALVPIGVAEATAASRITSPTKPSLKPLPKPKPVSAPTPAPGPDPLLSDGKLLPPGWIGHKHGGASRSWMIYRHEESRKRARSIKEMWRIHEEFVATTLGAGPSGKPPAEASETPSAVEHAPRSRPSSAVSFASTELVPAAEVSVGRVGASLVRRKSNAAENAASAVAAPPAPALATSMAEIMAAAQANAARLSEAHASSMRESEGVGTSGTESHLPFKKRMKSLPPVVFDRSLPDDEDLYEGDKDKAELLTKSELEREVILSERHERKQRRVEEMQVACERDHREDGDVGTSGGASGGGCSSSGGAKTALTREVTQEGCDDGYGSHLRVGDAVVAQDYKGYWLAAKVEMVKQESPSCFLKVHFIGWKSRWDEWIRIGDGRLQPTKEGEEGAQATGAGVHAAPAGNGPGGGGRKRSKGASTAAATSNRARSAPPPKLPPAPLAPPSKALSPAKATAAAIHDAALGLRARHTQKQHVVRLSSYGPSAHGERVRVRWQGFVGRSYRDEWYEGAVDDFDEASQHHHVSYDDGDDAWYHLDDEAAAGRLEWCGQGLARTRRRSAAAAAADAAVADAAATAASNAEPPLLREWSWGDDGKLVGKVYGKKGMKDGTVITTSVVTRTSFYTTHAITESGTVYLLGEEAEPGLRKEDLAERGVAARVGRTEGGAARDEFSGTVCSVCQEECEAGQSDWNVTECRHVFHDACLLKWVTLCAADESRTPDCPDCRRPLPSSRFRLNRLFT